MRIVIVLGGTNIRVARVENGMIVAKVTASCPAKEDEQTVLHALEKLIGQLICPEVESIGIGVPSIVDSKEGVVYNVANIPAWKEVPLKQLLEARFGIPVYVNNDSNCFALGVKNFGEGKPYSDMVGITLGTGVGSGIGINGRLYNGRNTGAGEIGSLPYLEHDFEHYFSAPSMPQGKKERLASISLQGIEILAFSLYHIARKFLVFFLRLFLLYIVAA